VPVEFRLVPAIFSDHQFGFKFQSTIGQRYLIEGSLDLNHWLQLTNVVAAEPLLQFFDAESRNLERRFYRARIP
jgi:hypothetical protein